MCKIRMKRIKIKNKKINKMNQMNRARKMGICKMRIRNNKYHKKKKMQTKNKMKATKSLKWKFLNQELRFTHLKCSSLC